jgi:multisubunit Na+/H+ antiporter MnhF subunit
VALLAIKPGPPPVSAVLRAHLAVKSDLVLSLAVTIFNLIPGSIVLEIDQKRRMLYMHVIDVGNDRGVDRFYRQVTQIERLLVAAFERKAVWVIAAVMLTAAAAATMIRLLAGPSTLDRLVAVDTLVAVTMCGIGTWAAFSRDTTVTYGLTALALISFVGTVSVARFRVPDVPTRRKRGPR